MSKDNFGFQRLSSNPLEIQLLRPSPKRVSWSLESSIQINTIRLNELPPSGETGLLVALWPWPIGRRPILWGHLCNERPPPLGFALPDLLTGFAGTFSFRPEASNRF